MKLFYIAFSEYPTGSSLAGKWYARFERDFCSKPGYLVSKASIERLKRLIIKKRRYTYRGALSRGKYERYSDSSNSFWRSWTF